MLNVQISNDFYLFAHTRPQEIMNTFMDAQLSRRLYSTMAHVEELKQYGLIGTNPLTFK